MLFPKQRNRGVTLLLALAVLAVLALLATSFVRLMSVERDGAANNVLSVRAMMASEAGVARAISSMQELAGTTSDPTNDPWMFRNDAGTDLEYSEFTPLEEAKFPSLPFDRDGDGTFENGVGGTSTDDLVYGRAVSGVIASVGASGTAVGATGSGYGRATLDELGLAYVLRIRDTNGKLNINGQQASMATMLDHLGEAIEDIEFYDPIAGRGATIVAFRDARPSGELRSLNELVGLLTESEIQDLRPYLTCQSWLDDSTVAPDAQTSAGSLPTLTIEERHPVNINTTAKVVLIALTRGLAGMARTAGATGDTMVATAAITESQAGSIADAIIAERATTPIRTFTQLRTLLDGLSIGLSGAQVEVLMANFDPSTRLNQFNPGRARAVRASKSDLTYWSTEICFGSHGTFEIESLGLATYRGGLVVGRANQIVVVRVSDVIRHTSQAHFATGKISSTNSTSHPNHPDAPSSLLDGQVAMRVPHVAPVFTRTEYCVKITSKAGGKKSNHLVTHIPDKYVDDVMVSVTNTKGWKVVKEKHEPKTGIKGFKFAPGVLGGKKEESVTYCLTLPLSAMTALKIVTKAADKSFITEFPLDPPPPPGTTKTDPNGFKIEFLGFKLVSSDGTVTSGMGLPDRFYATFGSGYDADYGFVTAATTARTTGKALSGSALMPDGTLSSRSRAEPLSYAANKNMDPTQGTLEFWVKIGTDTSTGSTEPLLYAVNPVSGTSDALITRIERSGTSIVATRAYVGETLPQVGPYAYSATESIKDVASWRAHEWHHVAIVWFNGTDQRLYLDGTLVTDKTTSTLPNKLSENDLTDRMCIGGYTYAGSTKRYSNSTIAALKVFTALEYSGASFASPERFLAHDGTTLCYWQGKLTPPGYASGARIVGISWTERRPDGWAATTYSGTSAPDVEVDYRLSGTVAWTAVPKTASGADGGGVDTNLLLAPYSGTGAKPGLDYRLRFTGTTIPYDAAPAVDEVRIIVVHTPVFLSRVID